MDDSDSEYEIEESIILVELNGIIDSNFLMEQQNSAKILGIDSEEPVLQLGHYIFNGEYEDTLGTVVVYQPTDSSKLDESFEEGYSYLCKTDKKLSMKRIFIQEKGEDSLKTSQAPPNEISIPNGSVNGHVDDVIINPASLAGLESIEREANAETLGTSKEVGVLPETSSSSGDLVVRSIVKVDDKPEEQKVSNIDPSEIKESKESAVPSHKDSGKSGDEPNEQTQKGSLKRKIEYGEKNDDDHSMCSDLRPKKVKSNEDDGQASSALECPNALDDNSKDSAQVLDSRASSGTICSSSAKPSTSSNAESNMDFSEETSQQNTTDEPMFITRPFDDGNASTNEVNMETTNPQYFEDPEFISHVDVNQLVESSTDKMLDTVPSSDENVPRDDNCSSSGDTQASTIPLSHNLDVCQSSDSKSESAKYKNTEASSSQAHVEINVLDMDESSTSHEPKNAGCEVSQSLKEDNESPVRDDSDLKDNECEAYSSNNTMYGLMSSEPPEDSNLGVSNENQISVATASGTRKLSSCEVSQSNNSESEYLRNKDTASECDVFVESPAAANENILHSLDNISEAPDEYARYSQTSESSTSEISQSHRSVILEGNYIEDIPRNTGDVCSQSSDKSQTTTGISEPKDVCVSSCDLTEGSSNHPSSEGRTGRKNLSCEVSQSDESDENQIVSGNAGYLEDQADIMNECEDSDNVLVCEESEIELRGVESSEGTHEAMIDTNTQNSCEVTQSFCSEKNYAENSNIEDKTSNECGIYEESLPTMETSGRISNNSCVSSDDVGEFSGSLISVSNENNPIEKDSRCEVSQSFSPTSKSIDIEESCASSDAETRNEDPNCSFIDETESQSYGEVSQSLEPESEYLVLESDEDDDMNECNQDEMLENSEIPSDSSFEICESSDAVTVHISTEDGHFESTAEQLGSGCEVSQSDRLEENLDPQIHLAIAVEIEGSNECEVAESMSVQEPSLIYCIPGEICESSDDVDNAALQNELVTIDVCQSSKSEENTQLLSAVSEGGDVTENSPNESIGVCESSEDVQMQDLVTETDACTSSERSEVDHNLCDSFSRQTVPGSSRQFFHRDNNGRVSQSQTDGKQSEVYAVAPSSSEQSVSVIVSSSVVDVRNYDGTDVIYSSPNTGNSNIASNVEVSQSSYSSPHVSSNVNLLTSSLVSTHSRLRVPSQAEQHPDIEESHNVSVESMNIAAAPTNDTCFSSDNSNNPVVESSTMISNPASAEERQRTSNQANLVENPSNEASTSQASHKDKRESVILENRKSVSTSSRSFAGESSQSNQPQQQEQMQRMVRSDNSNATSRPSLLEVIVSSASDFRNSLMCDPNSFKDRNQVPSISESTTRIDSASGSQEGIEINPSVPSGSLPIQSKNYESTDTEVSGSMELDPNYPSNEPVSNLHRVSQSSDVVNTHSSSSNIHSQFGEGIGNSSQLDIVQSSSTTLKSTSYLAPNVSSDMSEQVSSAEGNANFPRFKISDSGEVSESSCAQVSMPSCSANSRLSCVDNIEIIESSDDLPTFHEGDESDFNYESEVSSTPLVIQDGCLQLLSADGSEQCSIIEGNVMLLSTDEIINPSNEVSNLDVSSANSGAGPFQHGNEVADATNEAETLNRSSTSSPPPRQLDINEQVPLSSADIPTESVETNTSDSPSSILEVVSEVYDCDGSSEVSESLAAEQSDVTQSSLTDSKVSCSAVEFTLNDQSLNRNYFNDGEFPNISREAESKSSDDGISSYGNACDDTVLLQGQNMPSSANNELSMYSYEGEYDDSIQSSSLEAVQESICEQIKADSPQNFSNSSNSEGHASGSVDPYIPVVSESQSLSPVASVPNVDVSSSFSVSQSHEHGEGISGAISSSEDSSDGLEISDFSADPHVITDSSSLHECLESSNIPIDDYDLQPPDDEPSELGVAEAVHLDVETSDLFESTDVPFNDNEKNS